MELELNTCTAFIIFEGMTLSVLFPSSSATWNQVGASSHEVGVVHRELWLRQR